MWTLLYKGIQELQSSVWKNVRQFDSGVVYPPWTLGVAKIWINKTFTRRENLLCQFVSCSRTSSADDVDIVRLSLLWTLLLFTERASLFYTMVDVKDFYVRLAEIFIIGLFMIIFTKKAIICIFRPRSVPRPCNRGGCGQVVRNLFATGGAEGKTMLETFTTCGGPRRLYAFVSLKVWIWAHLFLVLAMKSCWESLTSLAWETCCFRR